MRTLLVSMGIERIPVPSAYAKYFPSAEMEAYVTAFSLGLAVSWLCPESC